MSGFEVTLRNSASDISPGTVPTRAIAHNNFPWVRICRTVEIYQTSGAYSQAETRAHARLSGGHFF